MGCYNGTVCRCLHLITFKKMAWLTTLIRRFAGLRCYRITLRKSLQLIVLSLVTLTFWNIQTIRLISVLPSRRSLPIFKYVRVPVTHLPLTISLPPPLPLLSPTPRPDAKYAMGKTILGCSELSDPRKPVDIARVEFLKNVSRTSHEDSTERLKSLLKNCTDLKIRHSYWRWPLTQQERHFPLAFGFKIHDAPAQFERLLRALWRPNNLYVIHVDLATSADIFQIIHDLAGCFDNVLLTKTRVNLIYASIVSLHADIECVKLALKSPVPWRYYQSVSGHEFPLRTNLEMVQILTLLNGTNDVENYFPGASFSRILKNESVAIGKFNSLSKIPRKPFANKAVMFRKGSAYFAATREFLAWVERHPVCGEFLAWLNLTWAADEMYWATANYLPGAPGGGKVDISHSADTFLSRAMTWAWDKYKCHGKYVRTVCIYGSRDLPWLLSRPELIANKFDDGRDPLVLDCLERALEERAERGFLEAQAYALSGSGSPPLLSTLNWTYYKALPHLRSGRGRGPVAGGSGGGGGG